MKIPSSLAEFQFDAAALIIRFNGFFVLSSFLFHCLIVTLFWVVELQRFQWFRQANGDVPDEIEIEIAVTIQWILCFDVN